MSGVLCVCELCVNTFYVQSVAHFAVWLELLISAGLTSGKCVRYRWCVLTGGHLQMYPCLVLLATAQVPPFLQGLSLQPSNTVSQRWPTHNHTYSSD